MLNPFISIISPVYKAENIVPLLVDQIRNVMESISENYEIVLVEDGSPDKSWIAIEQEAKKDKKVRGIKLSRNFGQHYAITAGLDNVKGEWIVVMDCDLQDNPSEIKKLYQKAMEGHKVVLGRREVRLDTWRKRLTSKIFFKVLSVLTGVRQDAAIANFGIYHKDVIKAVTQMREPFRSFPAMVRWTGFSPVAISINHSKRFEGKSTYNLKRLVKLAIDIILANSNKPLYYIVVFGFIVSMLAFLFSLIVFFQYIFGDIKVSGYTSLILSIWILCGLIIMFLGIVGLYIGKIFEATKKRHLYIIEEILN
jgi:polyisoprenyl-phosphate glycosyltransferase